MNEAYWKRDKKLDGDTGPSLISHVTVLMSLNLDRSVSSCVEAGPWTKVWVFCPSPTKDPLSIFSSSSLCLERLSLRKNIS